MRVVRVSCCDWVSGAGKGAGEVRVLSIRVRVLSIIPIPSRVGIVLFLMGQYLVPLTALGNS